MTADHAETAEATEHGESAATGSAQARQATGAGRASASRTIPPSAPEFRRALGEFATGVTVITAADAEGPVGFACQSFASVSLDPPLVLFCAGHSGRSWPRIRAVGQFCVNVLGEHQDDLCRRFGSSNGEKFDGLAWETSRWGTPALPGVLLRVHAEVDAVHVAGDHDVVIGRVLELETETGPAPLVFFRGGFGLEPSAPAPSAADWALAGPWGWGDHWD
ncbi:MULTISPECIES: flavin reductase family protein [Actinomadura]|uniref:Flavin reductase family protein n=1 Tax=Actinomadura yumaensis TaxID=111807 RepID=A0ABW2CP67_9ACTN|nr:flavin reductase family protein [Actinomadura sp. J1-007]MWK40344.1 flavin reductase [Actinomadura sp. J1-007]